MLSDRAKVETRQNFKCPLCLMDWHQSQSLLLHFEAIHLDLNVTWEKQGSHMQINVSVNRDVVFGIKYKLQPGQSEYYRFIYAHIPQFYHLPKNLNLAYAKQARNLSKRKVVLSSDSRAQKFRSITLEPIPTHQLEYDSEDEENIDRSWMKEANERVCPTELLITLINTNDFIQRIKDFSDFLEDERKFLILWNNYNMLVNY